MKRTVVALVLVLSILTLSGVTQEPRTKQWEYKFDYKCYEKGANDLAAQGWELVSSSTYTYSQVIVQMCVFKRAK